MRGAYIQYWICSVPCLPKRMQTYRFRETRFRELVRGEGMPCPQAYQQDVPYIPFFDAVNDRFNKRQEDFGGDLRAFNDYLEEVEEMSEFIEVC